MTVHLSSRCLDILNLLVASEQPLAAADIGNQLNISARMVRSSLAPAGEWLQNKNVSLRRVPGRGLYLVGPDASKRHLAEAIRVYDQPLLCLSTSERLHVALLMLCFSEYPVQVKELQQALNLSRTTSFSVLDVADRWLRGHKLQLIRRPNYGCMVIGEERAWRAAAIDLIRESAGDARLLALLQGVKTIVFVSSQAPTGFERALSTIWMKLNIALIKQLISPLEREFVGNLSDQAYIEIGFYLAVTVYRIGIGRQLNRPPDASKSTRIASRASEAGEIVARLHQRSGIQLPGTEVDWLALKIAEASPLPTPPTASREKPDAGIDPTIRKIVDRILIQASRSLHPSLRADVELIHNLAQHLESYLDPQPAQRGQPLGAPLLREVKTQFPYIYSVAHESSTFLSEQLGIELDEGEIGNLAVCLIAAMERLRQSDQPKKRVLVVCSEGTVTAWLLVSRLRVEFPDVEVAEVISSLELERRKYLDGIDVIVSTIPLKIKNIPHRQVGPLLGVDDCRKLKVLLQQTGSAPFTHPSLRSGTVHLADLLTTHTIDLGVEARDWREAVQKAGSRLLEAGIVERRFLRAMEEIILEYGPYMVIWPGAVLLHAPTDGVRQLGMELMTFKQPVCFGHAENDPVQIAIVLAARDNQSHITALHELNRLMQDPEARTTIASTTHRSAVLHLIAQSATSPEM